MLKAEETERALRAELNEARIGGQARQDVWPGEACLASSGAMLATTPKEMREAMGGRSAVLTTQTSSFFIASADPAQRSWLNGSVLKRELSDGYARLRPAMGLPG